MPQGKWRVAEKEQAMRKGIAIRILFVLVAFILAGEVRLFGQTSKGTIVGVVKDQKGGAVAGAKVTLEDASKGQSRETATEDNGVFRFVALPPGSYDLRIEQAGFAMVMVKSVIVAVDETRTVDVALKIASQQDTVTVSGAAELAQTESSQLGQVIDNMKTQELPLNGRNFAQLARLTTGVAASGGGGGQQGGEGGVSGYASNGQRSSSNNFMVDGIDNNDYFAGAVAQLPSIDSIEEFHVQTSTYDAEYGHNSGSVVNLVTKSGTNQFRGSVFEFLRNSVFDARNFFNEEPFQKPKLILNQFGGTLGGPVIKNRTFFFANFEGFRQRAGITRITNVPTDDQRNGIFTDSSGSTVTIPVDPTSAKIFALFPEPNLSSPKGNFVSSPTLQNETNQGLIKIDHRFSNADSLAARYSRTSADVLYPFTPGQSGTNVPGYGLQTSGGNQLFSLAYTRTISPKTLNEARFGFTRSTLLSVTQAGPRAADFGFNTGHAANEPLNLGNIPQIAFSGGFVTGASAVSNLGGAIDNPNSTVTNVFQFIDNLSHTSARHSWKFGFDARRLQLNRIYDLAFGGQITFSGTNNPQGIPNALVDFAEGHPAGSLQFVGNSGRGFRTSSFNFFAQDSYKVTGNLTVNYGLRYELSTVLHEVKDRFSSFWPDKFSTFLSPSVDQTDTAALQASGVVLQKDVGGIYQGDHNNFAPRVGLAYRVGGNAKTVVRAGYGFFYDTILGNIPGNVMLNPPFLPNFFVPAPFTLWPNSFAPTGFPVLTVIDKKLRSPYSQQFNLGIQRELPGTMLLEVSYVGSTGTKLPRFRQIDQGYITQAQINTLSPDVVTRMELMGIPPPAAAFLATHINMIPSIARGPYFGFAQIFQAEDSISSHYNSLQAKLDKRLSHGLTVLASYTYAKSIDGASVFFGSGANGTTIFPQDNYNLRAERGVSDFDIRHRLSLSYVYEVPSWRGAFSAMPHAIADGWQLGGILTLQTGQPFSVLTGSDNSSTGLGNDRPNLVGDPYAGTCPGTSSPKPRSVDCWVNPNAFAPNAVLTFGNSGRNILRGPGFHNFDFSIVKNTKFGEKLNTQFRAEFFNLTNHPNFALPNSVLSSPSFGTLFQTPDAAQNNVGLGSGGPRLVQFGLKLSF
jgi:hypothetical protein